MGGPKDITTQANRMAPEIGILYRHPVSSADDPAAYIGVVRVRQAGYYWAQLWRRTVRGKVVVELRLSPKT